MDRDIGNERLDLSGASEQRERKRRRRCDDDLEAQYYEKLSRNLQSNRPAEKKRKQWGDKPSPMDTQDSSDSKAETEGSDEIHKEDAVPIHEGLSKAPEHIDLAADEASRTVYLANVSTEAVVSKTAKKVLMTHLRSVLDSEATPPERLEKLRFRSLPFSSTKLPKKAAYITKAIRDSTTQAAQAYAVFSSQAAARKVAIEMNGTVILQRHLRADLNAHPSEKDHRRCVYVGNLNFVDNDTSMNANSQGETKPRTKLKAPADVEEGLWRVFIENAGPVASVRVPRDPVTRVGKGFAYVQFNVRIFLPSLVSLYSRLAYFLTKKFFFWIQDEVSAEKALMLHGQKFPPMLPRTLRVTRCKDPKWTVGALEKQRTRIAPSRVANVKGVEHKPKITPEQKSAAGRAAKLLGKGGASLVWQGKADSGKSSMATMQSSQQIVFEGRRANAKDGKPEGMKFGKVRGKSHGRKPMNRSTRRAAEWRKRSGK